MEMVLYKLVSPSGGVGLARANLHRSIREPLMDDGSAYSHFRRMIHETRPSGLVGTKTKYGEREREKKKRRKKREMNLLNVRFK